MAYPFGHNYYHPFTFEQADEVAGLDKAYTCFSDVFVTHEENNSRVRDVEMANEVSDDPYASLHTKPPPPSPVLPSASTPAYAGMPQQPSIQPWSSLTHALDLRRVYTQTERVLPIRQPSQPLASFPTTSFSCEGVPQRQGTPQNSSGSSLAHALDSPRGSTNTRRIFSAAESSQPPASAFASPHEGVLQIPGLPSDSSLSVPADHFDQALLENLTGYLLSDPSDALYQGPPPENDPLAQPHLHKVTSRDIDIPPCKKRRFEEDEANAPDHILTQMSLPLPTQPQAPKRRRTVAPTAIALNSAGNSIGSSPGVITASDVLSSEPEFVKGSSTTSITAPKKPRFIVKCKWQGGCGEDLDINNIRPGEFHTHLMSYHQHPEEKGGTILCAWEGCNYTKAKGALVYTSISRHLAAKTHNHVHDPSATNPVSGGGLATHKCAFCTHTYCRKDAAIRCTCERNMQEQERKRVEKAKARGKENQEVTW